MLNDLFETLKRDVLPDCFSLTHFCVEFENAEEFHRAVGRPADFRRLVEKHTGITTENVYIDPWSSGFLGSIALALWFMEFDEDNWFSFADVQGRIAEYLSSRIYLKDRVELRLVKGNPPEMIRDLPVLVDYRNRSVCFLFCEFMG